VGDLCPAVQEWWDSNVFRPFYLVLAQSGDPDQRISPAGSLTEQQTFDGVEYAAFEGNMWRNTGIPIRWLPGPISQLSLSEPYAMSDHWHTSFAIRKRSLHIDFVSFFRMGPQTSYREYRVFCDGQEVNRGGGFAGFLGGNFTRQRNWPLAVEIDDHLLYIHRFLQYWVGAVRGQIVEDEVCSVWVRANKAAGCARQ